MYVSNINIQSQLEIFFKKWNISKYYLKYNKSSLKYYVSQDKKVTGSFINIVYVDIPGESYMKEEKL